MPCGCPTFNRSTCKCVPLFCNDHRDSQLDRSYFLYNQEIKHCSHCYVPSVQERRKALNDRTNWKLLFPNILFSVDLMWSLNTYNMYEKYCREILPWPTYFVWNEGIPESKELFRFRIEEDFTNFINYGLTWKTVIIGHKNTLQSADNLVECCTFCPRVTEVIIFSTIDMRHYPGYDNFNSFQYLTHLSISNCTSKEDFFNKWYSFPRLKFLVLKKCFYVSDEFIYGIIRNCKLKSLGISHCDRIGNNVIARLIIAMKCWLSITLRVRILSPELLSAFENTHSISHLDLNFQSCSASFARSAKERLEGLGHFVGRMVVNNLYNCKVKLKNSKLNCSDSDIGRAKVKDILEEQTVLECDF